MFENLRRQLMRKPEKEQWPVAVDPSSVNSSEPQQNADSAIVSSSVNSSDSQQNNNNSTSGSDHTSIEIGDEIQDEIHSAQSTNSDDSDSEHLTKENNLVNENHIKKSEETKIQSGPEVKKVEKNSNKKEEKREEKKGKGFLDSYELYVSCKSIIESLSKEMNGSILRWKHYIPRFRELFNNFQEKFEQLSELETSAKGEKTETPWNIFLASISENLDRFDELLTEFSSKNRSIPVVIDDFNKLLEEVFKLLVAFNQLDLDLFADTLIPQSYEELKVKTKEFYAKFLANMIPPYVYDYLKQVESSVLDPEVFKILPQPQKDLILVIAGEVNHFFQELNVNLDNLEINLSFKEGALVKEKTLPALFSSEKNEEGKTLPKKSILELNMEFLSKYAMLLDHAGYGNILPVYPYLEAKKLSWEKILDELEEKLSNKESIIASKRAEAQKNSLAMINGELKLVEDEYKKIFSARNLRDDQKNINDLQISDEEITELKNLKIHSLAKKLNKDKSKDYFKSELKKKIEAYNLLQEIKVLIENTEDLTDDKNRKRLLKKYEKSTASEAFTVVCKYYANINSRVAIAIKNLESHIQRIKSRAERHGFIFEKKPEVVIETLELKPGKEEASKKEEKKEKTEKPDEKKPEVVIESEKIDFNHLFKRCMELIDQTKLMTNAFLPKKTIHVADYAPSSTIYFDLVESRIDQCAEHLRTYLDAGLQAEWLLTLSLAKQSVSTLKEFYKRWIMGDEKEFAKNLAATPEENLKITLNLAKDAMRSMTALVETGRRLQHDPLVNQVLGMVGLGDLFAPASKKEEKKAVEQATEATQKAVPEQQAEQKPEQNQPNIELTEKMATYCKKFLAKSLGAKNFASLEKKIAEFKLKYTNPESIVALSPLEKNALLLSMDAIHQVFKKLFLALDDLEIQLFLQERRLQFIPLYHERSLYSLYIDFYRVYSTTLQAAGYENNLENMEIHPFTISKQVARYQKSSNLKQELEKEIKRQQEKQQEEPPQDDAVVEGPYYPSILERNLLQTLDFLQSRISTTEKAYPYIRFIKPLRDIITHEAIQNRENAGEIEAQNPLQENELPSDWDRLLGTIQKIQKKIMRSSEAQAKAQPEFEVLPPSLQASEAVLLPSSSRASAGSVAIHNPQEESQAPQTQKSSFNFSGIEELITQCKTYINQYLDPQMLSKLHNVGSDLHVLAANPLVVQLLKDLPELEQALEKTKILQSQCFPTNTKSIPIRANTPAEYINQVMQLLDGSYDNVQQLSTLVMKNYKQLTQLFSFTGIKTIFSPILSNFKINVEQQKQQDPLYNRLQFIICGHTDQWKNIKENLQALNKALKETSDETLEAVNKTVMKTHALIKDWKLLTKDQLAPPSLFKFALFGYQHLSEVISLMNTISQGQSVMMDRAWTLVFKVAQQLNLILRDIYVLLDEMEINLYLREGSLKNAEIIGGFSLTKIIQQLQNVWPGYSFKPEECFPFHQVILNRRKAILADCVTKEYSQSVFDFISSKVKDSIDQNKTSIKAQIVHLKTRSYLEVFNRLDVRLNDLAKKNHNMHLFYQGKKGKVLKELRYVGATKKDVILKIDLELNKLKDKRHQFFTANSKINSEDAIQALIELKNIYMQSGYTLMDALDEIGVHNPKYHQILMKDYNQLLHEAREADEAIAAERRGLKIIDFLAPPSQPNHKADNNHIKLIDDRIKQLEKELPKAWFKKTKAAKIELLIALKIHLRCDLTLDEAIHQIKKDHTANGKFYLLMEGRTGLMLQEIQQTPAQHTHEMIARIDIEIARLQDKRYHPYTFFAGCRTQVLEKRIKLLNDLKQKMIAEYKKQLKQNAQQEPRNVFNIVIESFAERTFLEKHEKELMKDLTARNKLGCLIPQLR